MTTPAFRILGPLEVELNERLVGLGRRERALLAVLLLNAGAVVSVERLIDGVWGEAPPSSAKHMVHEYVSRLRQALGDASRIATRVPGYLAVCSHDELDARRFYELAAAARMAASAGEHAEALRSHDEALRLWRGDALEGVDLEGDARVDVARRGGGSAGGLPPSDRALARAGLYGRCLLSHRRRAHVPGQAQAKMRSLAGDRDGCKHGRVQPHLARPGLHGQAHPHLGVRGPPPGTPVHARRPVPATGPYMFHPSYRFTPSIPEGTVRLVRNPWFRAWSQIAQPRGFPDEIIQRFGGSADEHIAAVLKGSADLATDVTRSSPAVLAAVQSQHASRLRRTRAAQTYFLALNTRIAPFDDVRVRQALNFAIDREHLRDITLGQGLSPVTCQILPPSLDGYQRYCPYTAQPSASEAWRAPDLARARRLVRASGTIGQRVTVWMPGWIGFTDKASTYIVSVLESLGYKARFRNADDPYYTQDKMHLQLGFAVWGPDYPATSGFVVKPLMCSGYNPVNEENTNYAPLANNA